MSTRPPPQLRPETKHNLTSLRFARRRQAAIDDTTRELTLECARLLTEDEGLSVREAGRIMGLTGGRISQILNPKDE